MMKRLICSVVGALLIVAGVKEIAERRKPVDPHRAVLRISDGKGICSAVQIKTPSGKSMVLTAGHCMDIVKNGGVAKDDDGVEHKLIPIDESMSVDLGLAQGIEGLPALDIAKEALRERESVKLIGSGLGMRPYMQEGKAVQIYTVKSPLFLIMNELAYIDCMGKGNREVVEGPLGLPLCIQAESLMVTTANAAQGMSGGPAIDSKGKVVGITSASVEGVGSGIVELKHIQALLKDK